MMLMTAQTSQQWTKGIHAQLTPDAGQGHWGCDMRCSPGELYVCVEGGCRNKHPHPKISVTSENKNVLFFKNC